MRKLRNYLLFLFTIVGCKEGEELIIRQKFVGPSKQLVFRALKGFASDRKFKMVNSNENFAIMVKESDVSIDMDEEVEEDDKIAIKEHLILFIGVTDKSYVIKATAMKDLLVIGKMKGIKRLGDVKEKNIKNKKAPVKIEDGSSMKKEIDELVQSVGDALDIEEIAVELKADKLTLEERKVIGKE